MTKKQQKQSKPKAKNNPKQRAGKPVKKKAAKKKNPGAKAQGKLIAMAAGKLATAIFNPHESSPIRFPSTFEPALTAAFKFMSTGALSVDKTSKTLGSYLVFKDCAYPLWARQVGSLAMSAYVKFFLSGDSFPQIAGENVSIYPAFANYSTFSKVGTWPVTMVPKPILGMSENSEYPFIYAPAGSYACIQLYSGGAFTPAGGAFNFEIEYTTTNDLGKLDSYVVNNLVSLAGTYIEYKATDAFSTGVWYRPVACGCLTKPTTVATTTVDYIQYGWITGGNLGTPISKAMDFYYPLAGFSAPDLSVATGIYNRVRMNGFSVLFSNTTAVLNKEGAVDAAVITTKTSSTATDVFSYTSNIAALSDIIPRQRYRGLLERGAYTYIQPQFGGDRFYRSVVDKDLPLFVLDNTRCYTFLDFSCSATDQSLLITADWLLECINDSQLFPTAVTTIPIEELRQIEAASLGVCPVTENFIHPMMMAKLAFDAGRKAWNAFRPYANPLAHRAVDYFLPPQRAVRDRAY